jgi:hypothetical protein
MTQDVECLLCKRETLSSNPSPTKGRKVGRWESIISGYLYKRRNMEKRMPCEDSDPGRTLRWSKVAFGKEKAFRIECSG